MRLTLILFLCWQKAKISDDITNHQHSILKNGSKLSNNKYGHRKKQVLKFNPKNIFNNPNIILFELLLNKTQLFTIYSQDYK